MSAERSGGLLGIGVALVSVPRFRRARARFGSRLLERLFRPDEIAYAARKRDGDHNLAARFAAKCAGRQALARLGTGRVRLRDVEVIRRRSGEPTLALCGDASASARELRIAVSLTHDPDFAMASIWVESA